MEWTVEQLAYLAGMVDGEGSISIFDSMGKARGYVHFRNRLILCVYNNDESVMLWIHKNFGGRLRLVKRTRAQWKPSYVWETGWQHARTILEAILPYLIIKKARAELFIEFAKTSKQYGKSGIPEPIALRRREIVEAMRELNQRGSNALVS